MNLLYGSNRLYFGSKLTCISVDQNRYLFFIIFFFGSNFFVLFIPSAPQITLTLCVIFTQKSLTV
jgi:hypothetical protein